MEIERKFVLEDSTQLDTDELILVAEYNVTQNYLSVTNNEELRIRAQTCCRTKATEFTLGYKYGSGLVREERTVPISFGLYEKLEGVCPGRPLKKNRYVYRIAGDREFVCDEFIDLYKDLVMLEVEFSDQEEAENYDFPYGREVTDDPSYSNRTLWRDNQNYPERR